MARTRIDFDVYQVDTTVTARVEISKWMSHDGNEKVATEIRFREGDGYMSDNDVVLTMPGAVFESIVAQYVDAKVKGEMEFAQNQADKAAREQAEAVIDPSFDL